MNRQYLVTLAACASLVSAPHEAVAGSDDVEKVGAVTLVGGMVLGVVGMVHGITNKIGIATSDAPSETHHTSWPGLIISLTAIGTSVVGASIAYAAAEGSGREKIYPLGFALALLPALIGTLTSLAISPFGGHARPPRRLTHEEREARSARIEQLRREAEKMKRDPEQPRRATDELEREAAPDFENVPHTKTASAGSKHVPF